MSKIGTSLSVMLDTVNSMIDSQSQVIAMKPTHSSEICYKMRKAVEDIVETMDVYYTVTGVQAILKDKRDGQVYTLNITPQK